VRDERPEHGGDRALRHGARHRHTTNGQQLLDVKLEADAEHDQDHSDLGELQKTIRQETGRVIRAETARRPVVVPVVMEL